ncbi:MAG: hypothetical protein CENE_01760 [Candidatus Celerinatantimonas neptuna]|nr:MAG: hypothetical protein CENE_01760 [Candidatus Celerinatantimonas neptuna]
MSKKATSALAVIIVLGGCIIAAPYVIKTKIAKQFQLIQLPGKIQEKATQQGLNVSIKTVRYQENGLKADSTVRVFVSQLSDPSQKACFDINNKINYGYGAFFSGNLAKIHSTLENTSPDPECGFTKNPKVQKDPVFVNIINQIFAKGSPFTSETNLPWFGGYQTTLNIAARTITQPSESEISAENLQFKPMQLKIKDNGKNRIKSTFQWQGLNLASTKKTSKPSYSVNLSIGTIFAHADQQQINELLSPVTFSLKAMPSTLVIYTPNSQDTQQFKVGQIEIKNNSSLSKGIFKSDLNTRINDLNINHVQLGHIIFNLNANQLASGLKKFMTLRKQRLASSASNQEFIKQHTDLLFSGMHIELKPVAIQQKAQQIGLMGHINIAKMTQSQTTQSTAQAIARLKHATSADMKLTIDTTMLKNTIHAIVSTIPKFRQYTQPITARYMQTIQRILLLQTRAGYFTFNKDKQEFKTQIKFNKGIFTLNGKAVRFH